MIDFFKEEEYEPGYSTVDKIIFASVGFATVTVILGIFFFMAISQRVGGLTILFGLLLGVLPYGILSFLKNRTIREMEDQFPSFLKDLAESKRGGMTILKSFESARSTDYGKLNQQVERVHQELTWGIPFPKVMQRLSRRLEESAVIQESLSIIIQSFESGGEITKTIESVAEDAGKLRDIIHEKNAQLRQQLVIMYVIYFLFIAITVGVYVMLGQLMGLGTTDPGALSGIGEVLGSGGGSSTNFCSGEIAPAQPFCTTSKVFGFVPPGMDLASEEAMKYSYGNMAYYKSLLFMMLMIQGISTAAVAGQVAEGSPSAGVKHALIMLPLAFLVYMFIIAPMGV